MPGLKSSVLSLCFDKLTKPDLEKILDIKLAMRNKALNLRDFRLELSPEVRKRIIDEGYDPKNGARPMERALARIVLAPFAIDILKERFKAKDVITAVLK